MPAIRVEPAELAQVAREMKGAEALLQELEPRIRQRSAALDWDAAPKSDLDEMVARAAGGAAVLASGAAALAQALLERAEAYRQADELSQERSGPPFDQWRSSFHGLGADIWRGAPGGPTSPQVPTAEQLRYLQRGLSVEEERFGPKTTVALQQLHAQYGLTTPPAGQIDPQAWALVGHHLNRAANGDHPGTPAIPLQPFVPYHTQNDPTYADVPFGTVDRYGSAGCTLTSLAMLVDYHRDSFEANRETMTNLANGSVNADGNVEWAKAEGYFQEQWGLQMVHQGLPQGPGALDVAMSQAHQALGQGEPVVIGLTNGANMHWVVIRGYSGEGAPTDPSQFLIHDPGNSSRKTLADLLNDPKYKGGQLEAVVHLQERGQPT